MGSVSASRRTKEDSHRGHRVRKVTKVLKGFEYEESDFVDFGALADVFCAVSDLGGLRVDLLYADTPMRFSPVTGYSVDLGFFDIAPSAPKPEKRSQKWL